MLELKTNLLLTFIFNCMKKRFTESQILATLKKQESGISIKEICREAGISEPTFYNWKARYGRIEANDVERMKELERENAELKKMFAEASIEIRAMRNIIESKL